MSQLPSVEALAASNLIEAFRLAATYVVQAQQGRDIRLACGKVFVHWGIPQRKEGIVQSSAIRFARLRVKFLKQVHGLVEEKKMNLLSRSDNATVFNRFRHILNKVNEYANNPFHESRHNLV